MWNEGPRWMSRLHAESKSHFTLHNHKYTILHPIYYSKCFYQTYIFHADVHVQTHFIFLEFLLRCWINKEHFISFLPHVALSTNPTAKYHYFNRKVRCVYSTYTHTRAHTQCEQWAHCVPIVIYFHYARYWYMHCIFILWVLPWYKLPSIDSS